MATKQNKHGQLNLPCLTIGVSIHVNDFHNGARQIQSKQLQIKYSQFKYSIMEHHICGAWKYSHLQKEVMNSAGSVNGHLCSYFNYKAAGLTLLLR